VKIRNLSILLAAIIMISPLAHADGGNPVTAVFQGVNGANDGSYYVSPYYGTINGQSATFYCVDFNNEVNFNQTWSANLTPMSGNLGDTRYGNPTNVATLSLTDPYYSEFTPEQLYEQAAWLTTQMGQFMGPNYLSNPTDVNNLIAIQYAIWDLFDPNAPSNSAAQGWILLAQENFGSINPNNFEILTNLPPVELTGQVQEFIVTSPEPGVVLLLGLGLAALLLFARRKQGRSALQELA
jgi:hypothetical protein